MRQSRENHGGDLVHTDSNSGQKACCVVGDRVGKGMYGRNRDGSRCGEMADVAGRMGRGTHPVFYPPSGFIILFASSRLR